MSDKIARFIISYYKWPQTLRIIFSFLLSLFLSFVFTIVCPLLGDKLYSYLKGHISSNSYIVIIDFFNDDIPKLITLATIITSLIWVGFNYSYEYCLRYRSERKFLEDMRNNKDNLNMNNNCIYEVFKLFVSNIATSFRIDQIQKICQQNYNYVDLSAALVLTSLSKKEKRGGDKEFSIKTEALSRIRRERVLQTCQLILKINHNIKLVYATEFHLIDVILNDSKWNDDFTHRVELGKLLTNVDNKKRIIGIKKSEYEKHKNKSRFKEYINWHIDKNWEAFLYIIDDSTFPLTLAKLGQNNACCDKLTDFLYVEYKKKNTEECLVFAQNDEGLCKCFERPSKQNYNPDPINTYKLLFDSLWKKEYSIENCTVIDISQKM